MAKYLKDIKKYRLYELTYNECLKHGRIFPTIVCWNKNCEQIGNMDFTENETKTIEEMEKWCKE